MNEAVTYEWSEEMGRAAFRAAHAAKGIRPWLMAAAGLIACLVAWWTYVRERDQSALLIGAFGIAWLALSIRSRFLFRRLAKDARRLVDDPNITILLTDSGVTIASGRNSRTVDWANVTEILDRNGFLLLYCGKIVAACLPEEHFTEAQLEFVKSHHRR